ncbi:glycosyltransferase [Aromatoleum evansii]|uniref:glycosyltransferase n=1 Tax=Aromatoleum evansii TaxID=59406 RepID=UPI00145D85F8|nr:glycosyltransferase [Aromatoleum evansii]NMG31016.1 glycosyltransferase [Aromatoleum evansii]
MKRVLMISDVYFPRINGVSTSIETFRRALREFDVEVRLVVPRYGNEVEEDGVVRVPGRSVPRDPEDRIVAWRAIRDAALREAEQCDVVHVQTPFLAHYAGRIAARALGLPLVLTYHTLFEEYLHHYAPFVPRQLLSFLARKVSRAQCNEVDAVIVPSTAMRDRLLAYGVRTPLQVLPTGIPLSRFQNGNGDRFRHARGISAATPLALFVGRVAHEKNIGFLLDVAREVRAAVPDFLLVICGEGPALAALRRRVAHDGSEAFVRFVGNLQRPRALSDCYAAANVFLFASRTETQGLVLLEAMAAGVPVIGLAAMGTIDILAPGRGAIAAADNVSAFSQTVIGLMRDQIRQRQLAGEARRFSAEWTDMAMASRLASLYAGLWCSPRSTSGRPDGPLKTPP